MKILLANLPWRRGSRWGVRAGSRWPHIKDARESSYQPFPFFLAYSAALLDREGFQVQLTDALAEKIPESVFLHRIQSDLPDLIVAETSTPSLAQDLRLLNELPQHIQVVLAGPEISIRSHEFLRQHDRVDFVLHGEYEHTLVALVRELLGARDFSSIPGLSFSTEGHIGTGPPAQLIQDLDELPWPRRQDLPMWAYLDVPGEIPTPSVQMISSRGCPYQCGFCAWPQMMYGGSNYRLRSIQDVLDEMEYCVHDLGFRSVYFDDDTFNISRRRTLEFAQELKRRQARGRIQVPWAIMARADLMTEHILVSLREAGLEAVKYGVESADQGLLDAIRKNMDFEQNDEMIRRTQSLGIKTHLAFTLGLPGETQQTLQETIDYAIDVSPHTLQFSITTPFPGTWYYDELKEAGLLASTEGSDYDGIRGSVIETPTLSSQQLKIAKEIAYKRWQKHVWLRESKNRGHRSGLWPTREQIARTFRHDGLFGTLRIGFNYTKFMLEHRFSDNGKPAAVPAPMRIANEVRTSIQRDGFKITLGKARKRLDPRRKIKEYQQILGVMDQQHAYTGPNMVQIDPTNDCNSNCIGCWCHSDLLKERKYAAPIKGMTLPYELLTRLVDELAAMGTSAIYVAGGGEPFMHPRLLDFVEYAKKEHRLNCYINTNFTSVNQGVIERLCSIGVDFLTVSIWAGTSKVYADTHPNKSEETFYRLKNQLLALNSTKPKGVAFTKVNHVINNLNFHELEAMLDFAIDTKSNAVEFTVTDTIAGYTDCLILNAEQLEESRRQCKRIEKRAGKHLKINGCQILNWEHFLRRLNDPRAERAEYDSEFIKTLPCYVGWTYARVNPDGTVNSCLKSHRFPLGNLHESSFADIWNGAEQRTFRSHALAQDKAKDSFFRIIGNDPECELGCYKSCDNIFDNQKMEVVMKGLAPFERFLLDRGAMFLKKGRG